jgi:hypothetical protein
MLRTVRNTQVLLIATSGKIARAARTASGYGTGGGFFGIPLSKKPCW